MLTACQLERLIRSGDSATVSLAHQYLDLLQADNAAKSFKTFVKMFWPVVATSPLQEGWYLDAICDHLAHLPTIKRLIINIPPRHGKSSICSVLYPAWFWITYPPTKFMCSSYSLKELSTRDSIACRTVIESPQYQRAWHDRFHLSPDQNTKTRFNNDKLGFRLATSTESANLGEGCDVLIGDDLNNVAKVHSDADRLGVINWWTTVMSTRMNPGGLDCKVIIQQRCHEEDITGYILAHDQEGAWTRLILPWEYDADRKTITTIWNDPRSTSGEPLSNLYSNQQIEEKRGGNGLGPTGFATQFNQRPAPAEGNLFQKDWFKTYHETPTSYLLDGTEVQKDLCHIFITTDLAISLKTTADYTVAQVWCITPHNHLLLIDQFRDRVETPEALTAFQRLVQQYHPDALHVEDVAFQRAYIRLAKDKGLPVKSLNPQGLGDKKARCQRSLVKAECGQIWLPESRSWLSGWVDEVVQFPNAAHDDQVDCLAWAGIVAQRYPTRPLPPPAPALTVQEKLRQREARLLG